MDLPLGYMYNITTKNNTVVFKRYDSNDNSLLNTLTITFATGNWTHQEIAAYIVNQWNTAYPSNTITLVYDVDKLKYLCTCVSTTTYIATDTAYDISSKLLGFQVGDKITSVGNLTSGCATSILNEYVYLYSPQISSSSFIQNLGGNGIIEKIPAIATRGNRQYSTNTNMQENLLDCSFIPNMWTFSIIDKYGNDIELPSNINVNFTLQIFPL